MKRPPKKLGTNSVHLEYKMNAEFVRRALKILALIERGMITHANLAKHTGLSRRQLGYTISKLIDNGYCIDATKKSNKWKVYRVSVAGKSLLGGLRGGEDYLRKVMNENVRAKCEIHNINNIQKMIEVNKDFIKTPNWKNGSQWHGRIDEYPIEINQGTHNASVKIISPRYFAETGAEAGFVTISGILDVCKRIDAKWNLGLSFPIFYEGEFVIHTPYAQAVMKKTGGRQVKFGDFKINESPPFRIPHEEFAKAIDVDKHLAVPAKLDKLIDSIEQTNQQNRESHDKQDKINEKVTSLLEVLAITTKDNSTKLDNVGQNISKLADSLTNLAGQNQGTKNPKEMPKDNLSNMFQ